MKIDVACENPNPNALFARCHPSTTLKHPFSKRLC